jgi:TPR repeat protein
MKWLLAAARNGIPEAARQLAWEQVFGEKGKRNKRLARQWLKQAADSGSPEAVEELGMFEVIWPGRAGSPDVQYDLGMKLLRGTGVEKNLAEASELLRKAALQGHNAALEALYHPDLSFYWSWESMVDEMECTDSLVRMGQQFQSGLDSPVDLDLAYRCYSKAARLGHTGAMLEFGECYWFGEGCGEDESAALEWIAKAAANGNEDARLALEVIGYSAFKSWEDVPDDHYLGKLIETRYIKWLKEQAAAGNAAAMMKLDDLYCNELSMPKKWHELAMEKGEPGGYFEAVLKNLPRRVGKEPSNRVRQWFNTAVGILRERIDKGDLAAWYELGRGYERISVLRPGAKLISGIEGKILKCYLKAAEAGHAEAQYKAGLIYRHSSDLALDGSKAHEWLLKAAQEGHRKAQKELSRRYADDVIKDVGEIERRAWLHAAAKNGDIQAQNDLMKEHFECKDNDSKVSRNIINLPEARRWFFAQAYQGDFGDPQYDVVPNVLYRDDFEALKWMRRAESLGYRYAEESIREHEEKRKHYWVTAQAENGDASALFELALNHLYGLYGWDAETDPVKAVHLLKQAAAAGSIEAHTELGHLHILGISVEKSIDEAASWWNKAAGLGSMEAGLALKALEVFKHEISKDLNETRAADVNVDECDADNLAFFQTEAKNGDLEAMFKLGDYLIRNNGEQEGFQWLYQAAKAGHPRSCVYLSRCYSKGWGVSRNTDESEKWYRAAEEYYSESALAGDAAAITGLHELYGVKARSLLYNLFETDLDLFDLTHKLLHKAACLGDPQAQYGLGSHYLGMLFDEDGAEYQTVAGEIGRWERSANPWTALEKKDYEKLGSARNVFLEAVKWLRLSAYQRNLDARLKLGMVFNNWSLIKKNKEVASAWLDLFPNGNTSGECMIIGMGYTQDFWLYEHGTDYADVDHPKSSMGRIALERGIVDVPEKAVEYFRKAAELGNPAGMGRLGLLLLEDMRIEKQVNEALDWLLKSAERGDSAAQRKLGQLYSEGTEVEKEKTRAHYWYRKAAEAGNVKAMAELGKMYFDGNGITRNYDEAFKWLAGSKYYSREYLGHCYFNGWGVQRDRKKALELWSNWNGSIVDYYRGLAYLEGIDVEKDTQKGIDYLKKAAVRVEDARKKLEELGIHYEDGKESNYKEEAKRTAAAALSKSLDEITDDELLAEGELNPDEPAGNQEDETATNIFEEDEVPF